MLSTDDILFGLGLVLVLAVSAHRSPIGSGIPALAVLFPRVSSRSRDRRRAPGRLAGRARRPFDSVAVGAIMFEAGLRLSFDDSDIGIRSVVGRLLAAGIAVTLFGVAATVWLVFGDLDWGVSLLIGAILVVSGPTVVLPMLEFIRPTREGSLAPQVGGRAQLDPHWGRCSAVPRSPRPAELRLCTLRCRSASWSAALVGAVGAVVLLLLLRDLHLNAPEHLFSRPR